MSTLAADAATQLGPPNAVALYSPENGAAANVGAGFHGNHWPSRQANYIWNKNHLTLIQVDDRTFFEQERDTRQHAGVVDMLLYFRNRRSWARPYLSAGAGVVSIADALGNVRGGIEPPPKVAEVRALLRVAVGIDLMHSSGWGFRYSFSESISGNPHSAILKPRVLGTWQISRIYSALFAISSGSETERTGSAANKWERPPGFHQAGARGTPGMDFLP